MHFNRRTGIGRAVSAAPAAPAPRRSRAARGAFVALSVLTITIGGVVLGPGTHTPTYAADYPTWDDVQQAKDNESAKQSEITKIEALISQLQTRVTETQQAAETAGNEYYEAQQAYNLQKTRTEELEKQVKAESQKADKAAKQAGEIAAQQYRDGGEDTTLQLFFSGSAENTDDLLLQLGEKDMLIQHNKAVYDEAVGAKNTAASLAEQAEDQREARDELQQDAEEKFQIAQEANEAAEQALADQDANLATLQAQLAALKDDTAQTVKDYKAGVAAAKKAEEERKAREAAAAKAAAEKAEKERKAQEKAEREAAQNSGSSGGGGSSSGGSGGGGGGSSSGGSKPSSGGGSNGWSRPLNGVMTSDYGPRYSQCGPSYCASGFHEGIDLASYCGDYVYAAHSGTVTYAGANGGYGNYVRIDNGDGTATGYGHNQWGGLLVSSGQWVESGQAIALEGNTGNSFGCHSHFEVYRWGSTVDPFPFLADRGIYY